MVTAVVVGDIDYDMMIRSESYQCGVLIVVVLVV